MHLVFKGALKMSTFTLLLLHFTLQQSKQLRYFLNTTLVVRVVRSVHCACLCDRTISFEQNDLWPAFSSQL